MIKLFSDMGADIPVEIAKKYKIQIFNMMVTDGENEYTLNSDIDKYKLFENMAKGIDYKTSQVSYKEFYDVFKAEILSENEIIYISLSSGLSGTFSTANMVKNDLLDEFPNAKIHIIDSLGASFGYGALTIKVAKMIENKESLEEILKYIDFYKNHINYIFTVDDLTYLYRGGRLNKAKFILGNLLNICPILDISKETGKLNFFDKVRGHKAFKKKIIDIVKKKSDCLDKQTIVILQGDCMDKANELKELLTKEFNNSDIIITGVDAVIGCHTGPSILAMVYLDELYGKYDNFEI
ncbi:DegV family protein [Parvimonas sp. KA00067]|uniref:DegV family protein n=1 Tax=Parvimonas TaxID=543311 RepID=UPI00079CCB93|nr:DegV family protein [Parvimonas sp. KA00067]KXB67684.1 EDD domain protein, DegV family [Parvimonas sp. KA00067]